MCSFVLLLVLVIAGAVANGYAGLVALAGGTNLLRNDAYTSNDLRELVVSLAAMALVNATVWFGARRLVRSWGGQGAWAPWIFVGFSLLLGFAALQALAEIIFGGDE